MSFIMSIVGSLFKTAISALAFIALFAVLAVYFVFNAITSLI